MRIAVIVSLIMIVAAAMLDCYPRVANLPLKERDMTLQARRMFPACLACVCPSQKARGLGLQG